ncbi:hypothetical protein [Neorhodopirellula pilleata]|uniref:Uncharacterized protein n=1 Tax=Neorhodopirellula pilleata TaxID=2714738 RepID=A0A5C6AR31_9BACT|nr:hypothetical protein [Neorhodopirellula pilleata]TWU01931.1 hypothetical protein Pla100_16670 [Neorhodopirellula pilleata]
MKRLFVILTAVSAAIVVGHSSAQAFGGHHRGGERVVSSQVVSDVAVGESYEGEVVSGGGGVQNRQYGQPDLFYNFYTQGPANSANAQMYVAPVPVPPNVGHTYLTYQPFYPHEFLYPHTDKFHNYYDNGRGMNRTKVQYSTSPVHSAVKNFYWNVLRIPR